MLRRVTSFFWLFLLVVGVVQAQDPMDVTIREINAVPQAQIDALNAGGAALTIGDIQGLIFNDLLGQRVHFTAVVLSDPLNYGLSTPTDGFPSRIGFSVRDTSAVLQGYEGMTLQLVNGGDFQSDGTLLLSVGSVIEIVGLVESPFGTLIQVAPETITDRGLYTDFSLPDSLLDPVVIETGDANMAVEGGYQVNWDNYSDLNGQYVRLDSATVLARNISAPRVDWDVTSDGGETLLNVYDASLRYRNDRGRGAYDPTVFNVLEDDFAPPPSGSLINLTGFVYFQPDDPFGRGVPNQGIMSIIPMEDTDLVVLESPPIITDLSKPDFVPGTDPITITVEANVDPMRTLGDVMLRYTTSASSDTITVAPSGGKTADSFSFEIPAADDGVFVSYWVTAADNTGAVSISGARQYRVLVDGINAIEDVQLTSDGGEGGSPFDGLTTDMDLTVAVQTTPGVSGLMYVQDDTTQAPWTGVNIRGSSDFDGLVRGDAIRITKARIQESFNLTRLRDITFEMVSTGGDGIPYKIITTDALQDESVAEAHEGMALRFDNVTITMPNADPFSSTSSCPEGAGFGEWAFSSDGTMDNQVRADDASDAIECGFNITAFTEGEPIAFIQGVWSFSFSNYKLLPETVSNDVDTAVEDETVPGSFALRQNYPNPFNPVTTIHYDVGVFSQVKLEVFDVLGRRVATLVDQQHGPGTHTVTFDAARLPSGLYLYRLEAGSTVKTKKMMLIK